MSDDDNAVDHEPSEEPGKLREAIEFAGKATAAVAGGTVALGKNVATGGARAAAGAVEQVRRRIPDRGPDELVRAAILDVVPPSSTPGEQPEPAVAMLISQFLLADYLASREQDEARRQKMERVVERQRTAIAELELPALDREADTVAAYVRSISTDEEIGFFVDLYFLDPFAPYTLKTKKGMRREALDRLAEVTGAATGIVDRIEATRRGALAAHARKSLGKIGYVGLGAAALLGVAGILVAPIVGAAIGAGAGLAGAAATAHGLAILGGGALAAGGAGMAGGMWVVAGVGAAAGLFGGGGGVALYELGSATAHGELIKLQITFKLGILDANRDMAKAQEAIANLVAQANDLKVLLVAERELNDDNAKRVKDLERTLEDIEEAIGWMKHEAEESVA